MVSVGQGERRPLRGPWRRYTLKEGAEEASSGEGSGRGKGLPPLVQELQKQERTFEGAGGTLLLQLSENMGLETVVA